jgi:DNA-binding transcriptional LysR family regulator
VPLFDRTTRRVELTTAGRTMLAHAVALLAAADRAWEDVQRVHKGEAGQVLLSYSPTVRRELLPLLLEEFGARQPDSDTIGRERVIATLVRPSASAESPHHTSHDFTTRSSSPSPSGG